MSIEWLEELETRVREAAERLGELRKENQALQERIGELETKLARAEEAASGRDGWDQEREEIRGRVERLTQHLAGLV